MSGFTHHDGKAALFDRDNVDTDLIIPMGPLLERPRSELGRWAFKAIRYDDHGQPLPDFPFHEPGAEGATIIVAGRNFGCGSSREGAVYALQGLGVRAIVASSYGDIFYGNAIKNGILPVRLNEGELVELTAALRERRAEDRLLWIDLPRQELATADGAAMTFAIHEGLKDQLLGGRDEIADTLDLLDDIKAFQAREAAEHCWMTPHAPTFRSA